MAEQKPSAAAGATKPNAVQIIFLTLAQLAPHPLNPRLVYSPEVIAGLAGEMIDGGFDAARPVAVRWAGESYQILDGDHRVRAARAIGINRIPCVVIKADDREAMMMLASANAEDPLSPLKHGLHSLTAETMGVSAAAYAATLRLDAAHLAQYREGAQVFLQVRSRLAPGDAAELRHYGEHLAAIHRAPSKMWFEIVVECGSLGWSVQETQMEVAALVLGGRDAKTSTSTPRTNREAAGAARAEKAASDPKPATAARPAAEAKAAAGVRAAAKAVAKAAAKVRANAKVRARAEAARVRAEAEAWVADPSCTAAQRRAEDEARRAAGRSNPGSNTGRSTKTPGDQALAHFGLSLPCSEDQVRKAFRRKVSEERAHPDQGGSTESFLAITALRDTAIAWVATYWKWETTWGRAPSS